MTGRKILCYVLTFLLFLTGIPYQGGDVKAASEQGEEVEEEELLKEFTMGEGINMDITLYKGSYSYSFELPDNFVHRVHVLKMRVFDIDSGAVGWTPEVDKIYLNDKYVGMLTGANEQWSEPTFEVPVGYLKAGKNILRMDVDTATEGDWVNKLDYFTLSDPVYQEDIILKEVKARSLSNIEDDVVYGLLEGEQEKDFTQELYGFVGERYKMRFEYENLSRILKYYDVSQKIVIKNKSNGKVVGKSSSFVINEDDKAEDMGQVEVTLPKEVGLYNVFLDVTYLKKGTDQAINVPQTVKQFDLYVSLGKAAHSDLVTYNDEDVTITNDMDKAAIKTAIEWASGTSNAEDALSKMSKSIYDIDTNDDENEIKWKITYLERLLKIGNYHSPIYYIDAEEENRYVDDSLISRVLAMLGESLGIRTGLSIYTYEKEDGKPFLCNATNKIERSAEYVQNNVSFSDKLHYPMWRLQKHDMVYYNGTYYDPFCGVIRNSLEDVSCAEFKIAYTKDKEYCEVYHSNDGEDLTLVRKDEGNGTYYLQADPSLYEDETSIMVPIESTKQPKNELSNVTVQYKEMNGVVEGIEVSGIFETEEEGDFSLDVILYGIRKDGTKEAIYADNRKIGKVTNDRMEFSASIAKQDINVKHLSDFESFVMETQVINENGYQKAILYTEISKNFMEIFREDVKVIVKDAVLQAKNVKNEYFYDLLEATATVIAKESGKYTVCATVYSNGTDYVINKEITDVQLAEGNNSVSVAFEGKEIYVPRKNGRYSVKISILDESNEEVCNKTVDGDTYRYEEFESPEAVISKVIGEEVRDSSLVITLGVYVKEAGKFSFEARLNDSESKNVSSNSVEYELGLGNHQIELIFSGKDILSSRVDGPYAVTWARITKDGQELDSLPQDYITKAYELNQFSSDEFILCDDYTVQAIDTDNTGKYNYMELYATVYIPADGSYTYNARILDANGREIEWQAAQQRFTKGFQEIHLRFDGRKLYGNNVDGYFCVKDLSINGIISCTFSKSFYSKEYKANQFEKCNSIKGYVLAGNKPVENASVFIGGVDFVQTGKDGSFVLKIPEDGTYIVGVDADEMYAPYNIVMNGENVGVGKTIRVTVENSAEVELNFISTTVNVNKAPRFTPIELLKARTGDNLEFILEATDEDNDTLNYFCEKLPEGATLDSNTGEFSWKIPLTQEEEVIILPFTVSDGKDSDEMQVAIEVVKNQVPKFDIIEDVEAFAGDKVEFKISAADGDNDKLTYSAQGLPEGAVFNTKTGEFAWDIPLTETEGKKTISFKVSDGKETSEMEFGIWVMVNQAPVFAKVKDQEVKTGDTVTFKVEATDADDDSITYSAKNLPEGAIFDTDTNEFTWDVPLTEEDGKKVIVFTASDKRETIELEVSILVTKNQVPEFIEVEDKVIRTGKQLAFTVEATDQDGDALTYSTKELPEGASLDKLTGEFVWNVPLEYEEGEKIITFTVTDGKETDELAVLIQVIQNQAPKFISIENQEVNAGKILKFSLEATDREEDELAYYAENLPQGATFDETTGEFIWQVPFVCEDTQVEVIFSVSDGELTSAMPVVFTIKTGKMLDVTVEKLESGNSCIQMKYTLKNVGNEDIKMSEIMLKIFYTVESDSTQNFTTYYCTKDVTPVGTVESVNFEDADTCMTVTFPKDKDSVITIGEEVTLQVAITNSDWSSYCTTNDFTTSENAAVYLDNQLLRGLEPNVEAQAKPPVIELTSNAVNPDETANISFSFTIKNAGNKAINLEDLKLEYFFTNDGNAEDIIMIDWCSIGKDVFNYQVDNLENSTETADRKLSIDFANNNGKLYANKEIQIFGRIYKQGYEKFDCSNDYSQNENSVTNPDNILLYYQGEIYSGVEPSTYA